MAVPFSIGIHWDGDLATLTVAGQLCLTVVPRVRTAIRRCLAELPAAVLVDAAGLTVDSDLPLAVFRATARVAEHWPRVPLLMYGADDPLAARLATHRFIAAFPDGGAARAAPTRPGPTVRADLPFDPGSLRPARRLVAMHGGEAELVVSELVSNALRHADPPLRLAVTARGRDVHVVVRDGSATPPSRRPGTIYFGPRGLRLVEAFARAWGSVPAVDGKAVWAIIRTRPALPGSTGRVMWRPGAASRG